MKNLLALLLIVAAGWFIFFYSSISLLYMRHEIEISGAPRGYLVQCRYFNATGLEWPEYGFSSPIDADRFYCPRWKHISSE
jgi:hypothetical protein